MIQKLTLEVTKKFRALLIHENVSEEPGNGDEHMYDHDLIQRIPEGQLCSLLGLSLALVKKLCSLRAQSDVLKSENRALESENDDMVEQLNAANKNLELIKNYVTVEYCGTQGDHKYCMFLLSIQSRKTKASIRQLNHLTINALK